MMKQLVIVGAGGHAKVVADMALASGWIVGGLTDNDVHKAGQTVIGRPILGGDDILDTMNRENIALTIGVGIGPGRRSLFEAWRAHGFEFPHLAHPSAIVARSAMIAEGAQIMAGAIVQPDVKIGRNAVINTSASIDHDSEISDHVFISPGVVVAGEVRVGLGVFVGAGAVLLPRVAIGAGAIIAAGAVVRENVADGATVMGVPARPRGQSERMIG
jgi:UDP-perosamine 4-acetyltransferase